MMIKVHSPTPQLPPSSLDKDATTRWIHVTAPAAAAAAAVTAIINAANAATAAAAAAVAANPSSAATKTSIGVATLPSPLPPSPP
jgi:hypothetical protein